MPVVEHAEIKYNTIVNKIAYRTSERDKVLLHTNTGASMEFDEVVLTAPLGWLKQNAGAFEPPLPNRLTKAIDSISYGCLEKVGWVPTRE
jgi:monoamine oxidase